MFIINLLILPAAFIIVFAMALFGGAAGEDDGSGGWKALRAGRKICYLAAILLPLIGVFLVVSQVPEVWPSLRAAWRILLLAVPGLLLGLANLHLAFLRRQRKCLLHWHILLTLSLLPSLALAEGVLLAWMLGD